MADKIDKGNPQLDTKPTDQAEIKKIKDFLKEKSKITSAKVDSISDNETDRRKVTRAVLKEHGMSEQHINQIKI